MSRSIPVQVLLDDEECLPTYATEHAAGADVKASLEHPLIIEPGAAALVPTGIRVEIPLGYEIQVRPRSGLALKHSVTVLNSPGTIDADYRGEIGIILINHGKENFVVTPGMRIAQLVLAPCVQAQFISVGSLSTTTRGTQGFGHTGYEALKRS